MSVIKIDNFGGEAPSVSERALGLGRARAASNLYSRTNEFRPLSNDTSYTPSPAILSNAAALFRFSRDSTGAVNNTMTQRWVSAAVPTNYAPGMLDDDMSERTYVTAADGTVEPYVLDNSGYSKVLGVPPPAAKPAITHTPADEFTLEEEANAKKTVPLQLFEAVRDSLSAGLFGSDPTLMSPATEALGWVQHGATGFTEDLPTTASGQYSFLMLCTTVGGVTAISAPLSSYSWSMNPVLSGAKITHTASGREFWAIPFALKGLGYLCNTSTLQTKLETIPNPSTGVVGAGASAWLNVAGGAGKTAFLAGSIAAEYSSTAVMAINNAIAALESARLVVSDVFLNRDTADAQMAATGTPLKEIYAARTTAAAKAQSDLLIASRRVLAEFDAVNIRIADTLRNQSFYVDGVAPLLPTAVTRITSDVFYLTTLVTAWGEESAPSLVSDMYSIDQNDSVVIARPAELASAPTVTKYGLVGWRLYRSNVGSAGASFQLVTDTNTGTYPNIQLLTGGGFDYFKTTMTSYTDNKSASELGEVLPSLEWLPPPVTIKNAVTYYMAGITPMASGVMAAFLDNMVLFSESYKPYAWPVQYQLTTKYRIVGLGAFGQSLLVLTTGSPYLCSGSDAASMSIQELPGTQSCVSARSIAKVENGVLYASPDGLCLGDSSGISVVTEGLFSREDWQRLTPSSIIGAYHDGVYFFKFTGNLPDGASGSGICCALDFLSKKLTRFACTGAAFYNDTQTDTLYISEAGMVKALFAATASKRTGTYKTGLIKMPKPDSFAWAQVDSDFSSTVTINVYGDGALKYTAAPTTLDPIRLPSGKYLEYQIEVVSASRITSVTLASSTAELQSV